MKLKSYFLSFLFVVFFSFANAQIIELTFTGKSGTYHVVLDSILIENITQGGDTMLYFPDTVIMLGTVGIEDNGGIEKPEFEILENYPNPFKNQTLIHLNVPETGDVEVFIYNVLGKEVATFSQCLSQGIHSFTFSSGSESMFFLTAIYMSEVRTCRMIGVNGDNNIQSVFRYNGILSNNPAKNSFTSIKGVPYNPGDQFRFVGFAYAGKDTIIDAPLTNYDYEFEFESGIHCPGISSFIYGGQNYSTVKIGDQCWMAENINIGNQINGVNDQTQNGIIEKYCFNDDPLNCQAYGGLYQWNEMMQYYTMPGSQGICPSGWHLPTDEEWKILEGNVDSQYGVGDPEWDIIGWRGFDVGKNLKSANSWSSGIGADLYGFSALAAGRRLSDGTFGSLNLMTYMWISSQYDNTNGWCRYLNDSYDNTRSGYFDKSDGRSVRCLKDTCSPLPTHANAGPDSLSIGSESIALMGNIAINGQGLWSVFSGTGGHFADSTNPTTLFFGLPNNIYNLVWTISNACGSSSDTVQIGFGCFLQPNQADAGPDQNNVCSPVNLTANVPMPGNGTWSILSGSGGSFSDINNPFAAFSGIQDSSYLLQWTISTICGSTSDVVSISFMPPPTQANAGPDSLQIVADSIALMGNIAINGQGLWSVFSGTGGSFADTTNPTTIFYGTPGTIYNLVWTISNDCGSSVDNVIISFATPFVCGDTLVDIRDWKNYNTVQIGTQCWMAENLTYMPSVSPASAGSETLPYYYVFGYQGTSVSAAKATSNYQTYGALYNWPAAMAGEAGSNSVPSGVQGVCPAGWHLPSDAEWTVLTDHLGGLSVAGGKMKETGITHWYSPNTGATNSSGFSALPGGAREIDSAFWSLGATASIWSSTDYSSSNALYRRLYYDTTNVNKWGWYKEAGFSVRCIENCFQANAGPDSLNITGDSIILMGNTPVIGQGVWTVINGAGGVFTDSTNPTTIFYGLPGITYNLIWTISNNCGSSSDNVIISFSAPPFVCGDTLLDIRDWKSYKTVQIGTQCWMAENLNIGTMIIGSQYQHDNGIFEKYCYDNDAANCITYGGLYQWDEMMQFVTTPGVQGICPAAWHLPSDEEWKILEGTVDSQYGIGDPEWDISGVYRGYDAGENLKFISGWNSGGNGTDLYGFSALPGGNRWGGGAFTSIGVRGFFWSSTEFVGGQPRARELKNDYVGVGSGDFFDGAGFSVRCLEDCSPQPTQSNAGPDSLNIFADSIALMGNIAINGQGLWSVFSGTGGSFADTTNPTTIFYGTSGTIYNLVWTISNSCGSSSDNVIIDFDASDGVKKVLSNVAVDGKLEESFWDISNQILINLGGSDNTASFGVLWDDDYLYIGVDVVDGTLCTNGRQGWYDDGIEICIDGDYSHGTTFNQYDRRFVKPMWSYWIQEEDGQLQQGVIHQWIETNDGYSMEFAIPWNNFNTTPSVGMNLGFNMVVNDDDNCISNNSLSHLLWTGSSNYYYNSSLWGTLELSGQTVSYSGDYLALINPNGGDFLINNKATIINWVSYGISNIDIEYTTDNGNNWTAIISNYAAVNAYYSWNVPASPSDQCLIRILESGNPSVNDISESVFTISAPLTAVQSLIPNTWKNYQWPYNAYFPLDPNGINGHVGNACGPTTIARILHKWEFPIVGNGMLNFTDNGGYTWSANFGATTYNYDNMPGYLSPSSTPTEYHDVATLNYHSATSMHDVWGSGTDLANMSYAMSQYFRYKVSTVILRKDFTKAEWTKIMMNELDSGRVLLIQGMNLEHLGNWHSNNNIAGHWYHVDGYNNEGKFHVVLGFGNYDGYFDADSLVIYSFNIGTLIGLEPDLNGKELSIIIPDGGNNYFPDADTTITWTSTNVSNIRIEYTLDKGQNWINIVNNTPASTGQFTWSVPDTVSLLCQVKISDVSDVNVYDKSDDVFTISDPGVFYCGNTIVDSRDGQIYNTVEIGNQCWLAENLNIGTRIDGVNAQTQNGTIEKYCYNNNTSNCDAYGGLYQWDEMMQYSTTEGVQGICQDGWHLPTDDEWKTLEGFVDNNYPVGAPIWNNTAWRGFDAGKNLKSVSSWSSNSGTNLFGFTALPGGMLEGSAFKDFVGYAYFWTSTENSGNSWFRALAHDRSDVYRNSFSKANGCTVRCIMN